MNDQDFIAWIVEPNNHIVVVAAENLPDTAEVGKRLEFVAQQSQD